MKRILVLGDSLTLPRFAPEVCAYEDTWPVRLKENFEVHLIAIGGGTIKDLYRQLAYHIAFNPDYVILQCGIVDCAPRALGLLELEIMQRIWLTNRFILPMIKRRSQRLRGLRNKTYTPPKVFERHLMKIKKLIGGAESFAVGILPSSAAYERIVPGVTKRVKEYNGIIERQFSNAFISTNEIDRNGVMSDHIHLNKDGHDFILKKVLSVVAIR